MLPQHPDRSYTEPHPQKGTSESGDGVHEGKRTHPKMPLEAGGFPCSYAHSSTIWSGAQAIGLDCALPLLNY